ncbi:MAG: replicative DNA helicase [Ignavibacteria bacterium]|jgi:replicative DNA helicase|nr:replicative DNA helicase [Ignavibacteria bacterium]
MKSSKAKEVKNNIVQSVANTFQGRKAPANYEAEVAVLGAMLLSREAVSKVINILAVENLKDANVAKSKSSNDISKVFYDLRHQEIFKAIVELDKNNIVPDLVTLTDYLNKMNALESAGGAYYLTEISLQTPTAAYVESHARIIQERYFKRCLIELAEEILEKNYDETTDVLEEIDETESKIFAISEKRIRRNYKSMHALANETMKLIENITRDSKQTGVSTGFSSLDNILNGGFQKSDLIILAARPSMGKTAFALELTLNAAMKSNKPVAFFSLEMNSVQLVMRMLTSLTMLDLKTPSKMRQNMPEIAKGISKLSSLPIYLDDSPSLSIMELRSKCRRLKVEQDIELIVVDYLQLIQSVKAESREREVSIISANLKQIARELEVPVLTLAQLNRSVETRTGKDKVPMLSDLRESGSIEQDADVVMFINRPEYYESNEEIVEREGWKNLAQILVRKHRNGATGDVNLSFLREIGKFTEREFRPDFPEPNSHQAAEPKYSVDAIRQHIHSTGGEGGDVNF